MTMAQCMMTNSTTSTDDGKPAELPFTTAPPDGEPRQQKTFIANLQAAIQSKNSPSLVPAVKLEMTGAVDSEAGIEWPAMSPALSPDTAPDSEDMEKEASAYKQLCSSHQGLGLQGAAAVAAEASDSKSQHPCHVCPGRYPTWSHLRRHLQTHTGYRPHACHSCAKRFRNYSKLKRHLLTHTGAKPYQCPVCERTVSRAEHLKRHLLVHSDLRPYKCAACDYTARRIDSLRTHQRSKHGDHETRVIYMAGGHDSDDFDCTDTGAATSEAVTPPKRKRKKKSKSTSSVKSANESFGAGQVLPPGDTDESDPAVMNFFMDKAAETEALLRHASQITGYDTSSIDTVTGEKTRHYGGGSIAGRLYRSNAAMSDTMSRSQTPEVDMNNRPSSSAPPARSADVSATYRPGEGATSMMIKAKNQQQAKSMELSVSKPVAAPAVSSQKLFESADVYSAGGDAYVQEAKLKPRLWEPAMPLQSAPQGVPYASFPAYFPATQPVSELYLQQNRYLMPDQLAAVTATSATAAYEAHNQGFYAARSLPVLPPGVRPENCQGVPGVDFLRKRLGQECDQPNRVAPSPARSDADSNY